MIGGEQTSPCAEGALLLLDLVLEISIPHFDFEGRGNSWSWSFRLTRQSSCDWWFLWFLDRLARLARSKLLEYLHYGELPLSQVLAWLNFGSVVARFHHVATLYILSSFGKAPRVVPRAPGSSRRHVLFTALTIARNFTEISQPMNVLLINIVIVTDNIVGMSHLSHLKVQFANGRSSCSSSSSCSVTPVPPVASKVRITQAGTIAWCGAVHTPRKYYV